MTEKARELRKNVLRISHAGQDGNLLSVFSSIEILRVLYDSILNLFPNDPDDRDRFVLSKGQSTMGLLAILSENGFISMEELLTACRYDSRVSMQADRTKLPFLENSAGSLGHGFPMAVGMAMGNRIKGCPGRIFVLAGDGEMNEGTMWEAALLAGSEKLDNLTLIIDDNESINEMLNIGDLSEKLRTFGFETATVNGHDEEALRVALSNERKGKPLAVIAKTNRGYGCKTFMEDRPWFHRAPSAEELIMLSEDVDSYE